MQVLIKIDVDTDRGTREGVPRLVNILKERGIAASFLFSLGPDNTGKAIRRIFRPGFFKKVSRTKVTELYGYRTLLNGTLLPAPHIGKRNEQAMRDARDAGFDVGIHCYDHFKWQDYLHHFSSEQTYEELGRALEEFQRIFGRKAIGAGAPGWQANERSLRAYDQAGFLYGSDTRGTVPFFPKVGDKQFRTLQIPTTLPTLDELLGHPEFPEESIPDHYMSLLSFKHTNVLTIHAEIEGMGKADLFCKLLDKMQGIGVQFVTLELLALACLEDRENIPVCAVAQQSVPGRSGNVACQIV
tara:strand:+ start:14295 stop:15191 length:897 start_codon:yes stop_codon:yes gene_type:complete